MKGQEFSLTALVRIIDRLTAYIGGATSTQCVVDWFRNGLPADLEPRMRVTFDIAKPISEVESELIAQGFLIGQWKEAGSYRFTAHMLRDADVETARSILMCVAASEFLSNEAPNIDNVASRLQAWIKHAELPENLDYTRHLWKGRLPLPLVHTSFSEEVQRKWDRGVDWPCWDQILAAAPEMSCARSEINLTTGFPFKYLRPQLPQPTKEATYESKTNSSNHG